MRVHHLNCGTLCPLAGHLLDRANPIGSRGHMVCHVLLAETAHGLVLIDTGIGTGDIGPGRGFGAGFDWLGQPRYDLAETAVAQVVSLGFKPEDVRHIVVTHLDLDHAGGLADFPRAFVHVHALEHDAAMERATFGERQRYLPRQWAHDIRWRRYAESGDQWLGFDAVRTLEGLDEDIALIPLHGHSRGHSVVAVRSEDRWLLHCGDGYFHRDTIRSPSRVPFGLRLFEMSAQYEGGPRRRNQERLRTLAAEHGDEVTLFCSHDAVEFRESCEASVESAEDVRKTAE